MVSEKTGLTEEWLERRTVVLTTDAHATPLTSSVYHMRSGILFYFCIIAAGALSLWEMPWFKFRFQYKM